jgi:SseB protein C-terminal domain/SseB protein N-terminal domain
MGSAQTGGQVTQLDKSLIAAQQDNSKANDFYNLFLNTDVYIPTQDMPEKDTVRRAEEGEKFTPVIIDRGGKKYLPIFDTLERLQVWAKRPIGYARMPSHALLRGIGNDIHIVLNLGTDYYKEFVSEELKKLQEAVGAAMSKEQKLPAGTQVFVGAPANIPSGLEDAVKTCLSRNKEVKAAYLGQVMINKEGEKPHLVLVIEMEPATENVFSAINQDVGVAIKGLLKDGEYIDLMKYDGQGLTASIVKKVKPFYVRAK